MTRFCEFTGDSKKHWNEVPSSKRTCEHMGFAICKLHDQPIVENLDGWRECCDECETPKQVKLPCSECDDGQFIYNGIHHEVEKQWGGTCNKCAYSPMFDERPPVS